MKMKKIFVLVLATVMMLSMAINVSADKAIWESEDIYEKDANGNQTDKIVAEATYRIDYFSGANCVRASNRIRYENELHESQYNFPAYIDLYVSVIGNSKDGDYGQTDIGYITTRNGSINVDIYIPIGVVTGTVDAHFEANKRRVTSNGVVYYNNGNFTTEMHNLSLIIP